MEQLTEEAFIRKYSGVWTELEKIYAAVHKKGIKALASRDVKSFLHLFRQCSHHLAYARTHFTKSGIEGYLNSLVSKCHSHVYAVDKFSLRELSGFILYGFPGLLKNYKLFVLSSFGVFAAGFLLSLLMVLNSDGNAALFLPKQLAEGVKGGDMGGGDWNYPLMSSYIMVNNISVALRAFVFGITLGIGTIYVLFFNGAMLGALTALVYLYSRPVEYWSLILPHGIIELAAIFISGAAGLMIAKSILLPGDYSRKHSLILGSKRAISLIAGVVLMLVIAGVIEGFFTPLEIASQWKLLFAMITFIGLAAYLAIPYFVKRASRAEGSLE